MGKDEVVPAEWKPRAAWGNQLEFILTCVGFAVGLGNVWRFPYLCYKNGGGAFLVPYFICLLILGVPIFYLELAFGQFGSLGPLKIWRINPALKGLGIAMLMISTIISLYYDVVIAICLYYFFASMTSQLPWKSCDNDWNTCNCRDGNQNETLIDPWAGSRPECRLYVRSTAKVIYGREELRKKEKPVNFTYTNETKSASEEYFNNKVLELTDGIDNPGNIKWDVMLCNLLSWTIVFIVLSKGIKSLGKVVYFTAIFPYILLTVLLVRGLTLDGYYEGIKYYLTPDVDKLTDANVWSDAAVQIFFSLSTCSGGLIAMASYNKFNNNCLRDALIVPIINCLTSFYAGFCIFAVLGFMAHAKGTTVDKVATDGPGLTFVVYPEGLAQMPVAPLWAILFFFMMATLGFSSQFSIVETVMTGLIDQFQSIFTSKRRIIFFRLVLCLIGFLLGLPMVTQGGFYLLNVVDTYIGGFPLLFVGFFEIVAIMAIYGFNKFRLDIQMMLGRHICISISYVYFATCWCFLSPIALLAVIVFKAKQYKPVTMGSYEYPHWGEAIGWLIVACPLFFIPAWCLLYFLKKGLVSLCCKLCRPQDNWGPALPENRTDPRYTARIELGTIIDPEKDDVLDNNTNDEKPPDYSITGHLNGGFVDDKPVSYPDISGFGHPNGGFVGDDDTSGTKF